MMPQGLLGDVIRYPTFVEVVAAPSAPTRRGLKGLMAPARQRDASMPWVQGSLGCGLWPSMGNEMEGSMLLGTIACLIPWRRLPNQPINHLHSFWVLLAIS